MKVAVLGASGMLGSMLVDYLSQHYQIIATVRNEQYKKPIPNVEWRLFDALPWLDINNVKEAIDGADWVINAIGLINQKFNQQQPWLHDENAITLNSILPHYLAKAALENDVHVINIATDCVFAGYDGPYNEYDLHDASDAYGSTKSCGEAAFRNIHHLRCSIVGPAKDNYSLLGWFLSQPQRAVVPGYTNHQWNGISTLHFAKLCKGLIGWGLQMPNLHHVVPRDSVSKAKLLKLFAKYFDREDITVKSVKAPQSIDRRLSTKRPDWNYTFWCLAGYNEPPTIETMVKELAAYIGGEHVGES